jgi:cytochrome c peroxidase
MISRSAASSSGALAINVIRTIPQYQAEFTKAFGSPGVDIGRVTDEIAEFEKTLVTPNSRFDQWLMGKTDALTPHELAGYQLFKNSGCVACHNGPAAGGGVVVIGPVDGGAPALLRAEAQIAQWLARAVSLGARRL